MPDRVMLISLDDTAVLLNVPRFLLEQLQRAWQADLNPAEGPSRDEFVVAAVRELFDGQDGALQFLAAIGIPTEPR